MTAFLLYLYAESPLHPGAAASDGALDLPIQREKSTNYPLIWGQSLKGALRQAARDAGWSTSQQKEVFGSEVSDEEESTPGKLAVGDAQLVALPVPTLRRSFAWATSQLALSRLARKYTIIGRGDTVPTIPNTDGKEGACGRGEWGGASPEVLGPCLVKLQRPGGGDNTPDPVTDWAKLLASDAVGDADHLSAFASKLAKDLLVVGSEPMSVLLRECTEFSVRVQLHPERKQVVEGPFTSEYLPAETILAAVLTLRGTPSPETVQRLRGLLHGSLLQVGGDETLGKGLVWTRIVEGNRNG
ncbi:type III-B CRISPR module RAMP protein Cmr4 [Thermobifida alba]|uniref:Type III-B CRISPR module RAMP protein Cmr4 n=1 Tax=Thermobifida alba TaxID=53522 RepID=A0ABY4KYX2_THEAE|nr:type III-B CRISPR module RAMP protein Cmr4 [Thermobifida alba]UPT20638.1 type III-B CRISPR module RAMP protein Cmr4 [Thermobifida alba]